MSTRKTKVEGGASKGASRRAPRGDRAANTSARSAPGAALDDRRLRAIEDAHPEGMTSAQIVDELNRLGVRLSEATFRKWVQLGLLPRSRRVGRPGKHQGSLGLYPPATVGVIADIRRRMEDGLTVEEIARSRRLRDEAEALERGVAGLIKSLSEQLAGMASLDESARARAARQLEQAEKVAADLFLRLGGLERRVVEPLEKQARDRAFGSGTSGGAEDLL